MRAVLGRKGDYSVRAVLDLASHTEQGRRKAREIATTMDIPERYLGQILANLVREGLLVAVAGPDGGYELAREPEEITLLEVVEASEGSIGLDECVLKGGLCDWSRCAWYTWRGPEHKRLSPTNSEWPHSPTSPVSTRRSQPGRTKRHSMPPGT